MFTSRVSYYIFSDFFSPAALFETHAQSPIFFRRNHFLLYAHVSTFPIFHKHKCISYSISKMLCAVVLLHWQQFHLVLPSTKSSTNNLEGIIFGYELPSYGDKFFFVIVVVRLKHKLFLIEKSICTEKWMHVLNGFVWKLVDNFRLVGNTMLCFLQSNSHLATRNIHCGGNLVASILLLLGIFTCAIFVTIT